MLLTQLAQAGLGALALAAYRGVPFTLWALGRPGVSVLARGMPIAILFAVTAMLASVGMNVEEIWVRAPLAVGYFACVGALVVELRGLACTRLGRALTFPVLGALYLGLPMSIGAGPLLAPTMVLAWERLLAAYSFVAETAASEVERRDALFFLAVDPSIVWCDRARVHRTDERVPTLLDTGDRGMRGLGQLAAQNIVVAMLAMAPELAPVDLLSEVGSVAAYGRFILVGLTVFLAMFLAHAGLANVQIAFLELAGLHVEERYNRPYLSTSPLDFWRRWNRWVGAWARRYVYEPARAGLRRAWPAAPDTLVTVIAFVATFAALGLLHDLAFVATSAHTSPELPVPGLIAFLGFAGVTLTWYLLVPRRIRRSDDPRTQLAYSVVGWLLLLQILAIAMWAGQPLLANGRIPSSLGGDAPTQRGTIDTLP